MYFNHLKNNREFDKTFKIYSIILTMRHEQLTASYSPFFSNSIFQELTSSGNQWQVHIGEQKAVGYRLRNISLLLAFLELFITNTRIDLVLISA